MRTLLCLLATVCACSATASSHGHVGVQSHGHGYNGSPHVIKIILSAGHGGGYSYGPSSYGNGGGGVGGAQIIKIISQNSASLDAGYGHGDSQNYDSQLHDILPQILPFILQNSGTNHGAAGNFNSGGSFTSGGGGGGGDDLHSQLVAHYGHMGDAVIRRSKGFHSGGHVVESGVLKIRRIKESHGHGHGW